MRIKDEYIFREDICNLDVVLEPYNDKYNTLNDELNNIDIKSNLYSRRLYFDDKFDIISKEYYKEELEVDDVYEVNLNEDFLDGLQLSCHVVINVYENNKHIKSIKIIEELIDE